MEPIRSYLRALALRPTLLPTALRVAIDHVPNKWWRRPPFLPIPDRRWVEFRMETAYGDKLARPSAGEVIDFLAFARAQHRARRFQGIRESAR